MAAFPARSARSHRSNDLRIRFPEVHPTWEHTRTFVNSSTAVDPTLMGAGLALTAAELAPTTVNPARAAAVASAPTIEVDLLYPAAEAVTSDLTVRTLGRLADAIKILGSARDAADKDDVIEADRWVQRFQVMLPELVSEARGRLRDSDQFTPFRLH